jgi:nicotinamide-nucleotide amidase
MSLLPEDIGRLAGEVVEANRALGRKIALAESCTGGLVAAALTDIAGSSAVLDCSTVSYSNRAKIDNLGVSSELVETFGAVSIAVVWAMAQGALERSDADVAVAISGIAGPGGGTEQKPVGTVVFACAERGADPENVVTERQNYDPEMSRDAIRLEATRHALALLMPKEEG